MQKNILGSRWQESKTSQTLLQFCVLYVHLPLPALVFTATTHHVSHQQTLLPVPLTAHGTNWVTVGHSGHRDSNTLQVPFPHTAEERRERSWAAAWWWSLHQGCSAHQQYLPCQDDDPGMHISREPPYITSYREKAPEGSGLHLFGLPVTILQFGRAQCTHVSIQHPGKASALLCKDSQSLIC